MVDLGLTESITSEFSLDFNLNFNSADAPGMSLSQASGTLVYVEGFPCVYVWIYLSIYACVWIYFSMDIIGILVYGPLAYGYTWYTRVCVWIYLCVQMHLTRREGEVTPAGKSQQAKVLRQKFCVSMRGLMV